MYKEEATALVGELIKEIEIELAHLSRLEQENPDMDFGEEKRAYSNVISIMHNKIDKLFKSPNDLKKEMGLYSN